MNDEDDAMDWLEAELTDSLDEDFELEMSDPHLSAEVKKIYRQARPPGMDRRDYFRQLTQFEPSRAGQFSKLKTCGLPATSKFMAVSSIRAKCQIHQAIECSQLFGIRRK